MFMLIAHVLFTVIITTVLSPTFAGPSINFLLGAVSVKDIIFTDDIIPIVVFKEGFKRTYEANAAGKNSSFIFTGCVNSVPLYHFKFAYVFLHMAAKEVFEADYQKWRNRPFYSVFIYRVVLADLEI